MNGLSNDNKIEKSLEALTNKLSFKEVESIEINGHCNDAGVIEQRFQNTLRFKDNATHHVSLVNLETTSFFPNVTESNNKFYYNDGTSNRVITLPPGAYDIEDYNKAIKSSIAKPDNITIELNNSTARSILSLKENYKVDFTKDDSWRECLGFEKRIYSTNTISPKLVNVLPIQKIYIECDICRGAYIDGKVSNILYSFPNTKRYGNHISLSPNPLRPKELLSKTFNSIRLVFKDDDGKPVTFQGAQVTVELQITQI